jgi:hypothetical protein
MDFDNATELYMKQNSTIKYIERLEESGVESQTNFEALTPIACSPINVISKYN